MTKRILRSLLVPAVAAAVLIPAGAAQARGVIDPPIYCGPAGCAPTPPPPPSYCNPFFFWTCWG